MVLVIMLTRLCVLFVNEVNLCWDGGAMFRRITIAGSLRVFLYTQKHLIDH